MIATRLPLMIEILRRWNEIEPILKRATDRTDGCYEPDDVIATLYTGRAGMMFVEADDDLVAVVVTELRQSPRKRVLDVSFCAAKAGHAVKLMDWVPVMMDSLDGIARQCGASMLSTTGRIGWARAAKFKLLGGAMSRRVES